jgi:hypothetical protein
MEVQKCFRDGMENPTLKLVDLFVRIDDACKRKNITMRQGRGRPCQLFPSEIVTIYVWFITSNACSFKAFYNGSQGEFLRQFFPKMPSYTAFLKQVQKLSMEFGTLAMEWNDSPKD